MSEIRTNLLKSERGDASPSAPFGLRVSGVTTTSTLTVSGDATIGGNLGVAGTITYEDVTNIDSVGIITARTGIRVTSGKIGINDTTPDATLSVGGATAFIDVGAAGGNRGKIGYNSNSLYFGTSSGSGEFIFSNTLDSNENPSHSSGVERLRITSDGKVSIGTPSPTGTLSIASGTYQSTTPESTADDIVISGNRSLGISFITLASGTSNNNIVFGDTDDTNIGMIRYAHADNSLQFTTNTAERFRIGSAGQLGIGGANYGSSGQVLTSGGSGAAFSWATPSGGITHIDQYRLTSSFTGDGTLQTNLEQCDTKMQGSLGAAMSVNTSTGSWTFPTTGFWRIDTQMMFECPTNVAQRYCYTYVHATTNNSSYSTIMESYVRFAQVSSNISWATAYGSVYVDITDVGNQKVRIKADVEDGNSKVYGHADLDMTAVRFTRMADT